MDDVERKLEAEGFERIGEPAIAAAGAGAVSTGALAPASQVRFQYRVLKALVLRDLTSRYADHRLGFLLSIIIPLATISVMFVAFGLRGKAVPANFSLGTFIVTGYPLWMAFQGTYQQVMSSAARSDPLLMFPQITQLDLVLSSVIVTFAINTVVFVILCLGVMVVFQSPPPADPAGVLFCYWGCGWIGAALGMILCALQRASTVFATFLNSLMRFGMWVSGVVFTIDRLPSWLWPYLRWNPILHLVEGARSLWQPGYHPPIFDPTFVIACAFVLTTIGFVLERASRRLVGP